MTCFSSLLTLSVPSEASAAQQKTYVTYTLSSLKQQDNIPTITLLESRSLLAAGGTTGLRTWEAAFHLGEYLCAKPSIVHGKAVLELGAGTGYISILCAKHLKASHVLATDGSDDVIASLATNFYLNDLEEHPEIEGKELKWGQALLGSEHPEWNAGRSIDVVLGADVTYDGSGIVSLLSTCGDLFDLFPKLKIIISATVRNQDTLNKFLDGCQQARYVVDQLDFPMTPSHMQQGPFYSDAVPIALYQIAKG